MRDHAILLASFDNFFPFATGRALLINCKRALLMAIKGSLHLTYRGLDNMHNKHRQRVVQTV